MPVMTYNDLTFLESEKNLNNNILFIKTYRCSKTA